MTKSVAVQLFARAWEVAKVQSIELHTRFFDEMKYVTHRFPRPSQPESKVKM